MRQKSAAGFTLIELILVIAVGGLIMVLVFLALDQAQRTNRDSQRKADAARYLNAARQFASDNNGTNPTCDISVDPAPLVTPCASVPVGFDSNYLTNAGAVFNDPKRHMPYTVTVEMIAPSPATPGSIYASTKATCATGVMATLPADSSSQRRFAVAIALESGHYYCVSY